MDPISSSSSRKRPIEDAASTTPRPGTPLQSRVSARAGQGVGGLSPRSHVSSSATATSTSSSSPPSIFSSTEQTTLQGSKQVLLLQYSSTGGGHTERCLLPVFEAFEAGTLKKGDCVVVLAPPRWEHDDKGSHVGKLHDLVKELTEKGLNVILKQSDKTVTGLYEDAGASKNVEMLKEFVLAPRRKNSVRSSIDLPTEDVPVPMAQANSAKDIVAAVIGAVGAGNLTKLSAIGDMAPALQKAARDCGITRSVEIGNHQGLFAGAGSVSLGEKNRAYLAKASSSGRFSQLALIDYNAKTNVLPKLGATLKLFGFTEQTTKADARKTVLTHLLEHAVKNDLAGGKYVHGIVKAENLKEAGDVKATVYLYVNAYTQGIVDHIRSQIEKKVPGYDKALFAVCGGGAFKTVPEGQAVENILYAMHAANADGMTSGGFGTTSEYNYLRAAGDYQGDLIVAPVEHQHEQEANAAQLVDMSEGRVGQASGIEEMKAALDALVLRRSTDSQVLTGTMEEMFACSSKPGSHAQHAASLLADKPEMTPSAEAAMKAMANYEAEHAPKEVRRILKLYVPALVAIIAKEPLVGVLATKKAGEVQQLEMTEVIAGMQAAAELGGDAALQDLLKIEIKNVNVKGLLTGFANELKALMQLAEEDRPRAAEKVLADLAYRALVLGW